MMILLKALFLVAIVLVFPMKQSSAQDTQSCVSTETWHANAPRSGWLMSWNGYVGDKNEAAAELWENPGRAQWIFFLVFTDEMNALWSCPQAAGEPYGERL